MVRTLYRLFNHFVLRIGVTRLHNCRKDTRLADVGNSRQICSPLDARETSEDKRCVAAVTRHTLVFISNTMKRGAEKQLSKDDADDEEIQEVDAPAQGLQKADESVLAQRTIRGLPKRSTRSPAPPLPSQSVATSSIGSTSTPKLATFGGFGSGSSGSPFSFTPPTTVPSSFGTSEAKPFSGSFSPAFLTTSTQPSSHLTSAPSPPVSSSASNATKTFASFISPAPPTTKPAEPTPSPEADSSKESGDNEAAVKYYSSLRGLNTSFLSAVSKAVESDPFLDIADVLEQYKNHRISVQKEYDGKSIRSSAAPITNGTFSPSMPSAPSAFVFAPSSSSSSSSKPPPMRAPPTGFSAFAPLKPVLESDTSSKSDASEKSSATTGFTFGSSAPPKLVPTSVSSSSSTSALPAPPSSAFSFATPPAESSSSLATNPFLPSKETTSALPFSLGGPTGGSTTSVFGSSFKPSGLFGASSTTSSKSDADDKKDKDGDTDKEEEEDKDKASGSGAKLFGGDSGSAPFGTSTPVKSASSGSVFGSGSPGRTSPFTFGSGSIGNPVGFGFGSVGGSDASPPASKVGFAFGAPALAPPKVKADSPSEEESSRDATPATESEGSENPYDKEGPGEEDEETIHTVKAVVYMMPTSGGAWKGLGTGMTRLKKHKTTDARRIIHRTSAKGKVTMNFSLYPGMTPKSAKNTVTFVGVDDDKKPTRYRLRLSTDVAAADLQNALEREIAFVKASE
ncbi:hypothetical protein EW146_g4407 [Bondarzewia mesenterica]|uniref:RanBD1 domain-containing protein n=1 Tax=Bondarzewia mesenterica TaxID=1095465 RepID=A0A4S4LUT3_9AGAM|nr:hypothetical protein EW146_g4407 [Bondarzewia mesenterica]